MKIKIAFIYLILFTQNISFGQTEICAIKNATYICLDPKIKMDTTVKFNGRKYSYFEKDSSGHYTVLGNIHNGIPRGYWSFYSKNVDRKSNGLSFWKIEEYSWCAGKVKKGKLHGKCYFYGIENKVYKNGLLMDSWKF